MSGTTVTSTTLAGIALSNTASNPLYIDSGVVVGNTDAAAVSGSAAVAWTITNAGQIAASGSTAASIGIALAGGGDVTNTAGASITAYSAGVSLASAGTVTNAGTISASQTAGTFFTTASIASGSLIVPSSGGVVMNGGTLANTGTGSIAATYFGVAMSGGGSVANAGTITASGSVGFGVFLPAGGFITNTGSIGSKFDGVLALGTVGGTLTNSGIITGGTAHAGVYFDGPTNVWNNQGGTIAGGQLGMLVYGAGSLDNAGVIQDYGTIGGSAFNVRGAGSVINEEHGTITSGNVGIYLEGAGTVTNDGSVASTLPMATYYKTVNGHKYYYYDGYRSAVVLRGGGSITNAQNAAITSKDIGVLVGKEFGVQAGGVGTVTNFGTIASQAPDSREYKGFAGAYLKTGGYVYNAPTGRITGEWKGVAFGYVPASGSAFPTTIAGTLNNEGYVFASDGTNGAALWVHSTGVILNSGTIAGGPFGVVAYYDTTIRNSGTIYGSEFSVFQSNTAASNLVQVAPGASFVGVVLGGAELNLANGVTTAAEGTLELQAGAGAGTIEGFADRFTAGQGNYLSSTARYFNFSEVLIDSGATWTLGGTVSAGQTVDFAGTGQLTLASPAAMLGGIANFTAGDSLVLSGVTGVTSAVVNASDQLVIDTASGTAATLQLLTPTAAGTSFPIVQADGNTELIACFAEGTRLATEHGELPVQAIAPGTRLRSPFGGSHEVIWTGHRRTDCRRHPRPHDVQPVRVQAGAFADGVPARDLWLSPDHAVFVAGVLIPVRYLINGRSIAQMDVDSVVYWHVELPRHDVVLAEGLACESYLDTGNRAAFANGGAATMLHPQFALQIWQAQACAELVRDGARLAAVRKRLLARAAILGHTLTDDPGLTVRAGGRALRLRREGARVRVAAPGGTIRLRSRVWVPAHARADETDSRTLGVAVADLRLNGHPIPLDDQSLTGGWHAPEAEWRWTDGDGVLELRERGEVSFALAVAGSYWRDSGRAARRYASGSVSGSGL